MVTDQKPPEGKEECAMYEHVKWQGKTLKEWQEALHNTYSLGELYRMVQDGKDLAALTNVCS